LAQWKRGMFTHSHTNSMFVLTLLSRAHNPEVTGSKPVAAIEASLFLHFFFINNIYRCLSRLPERSSKSIFLLPFFCVMRLIR
jgi:hypothetical protein